jgi:tetratricopeptide (TPR) repeat protein
MYTQCVPEQSATYSPAGNIGLSVDHYGLNKFQSKDDESYNRILRKLLSLIKPIAAKKQPRLYSVPVTTVKTYTERQILSAAVTEGLRVRHEKASIPYALAIYGLGGTGKTQLALKYVEDRKDEYNPILWIDAKDKESVLLSYELCALELQLQISSKESHSTSLAYSPTVQAVRRWLENRKGTDDAWLVVVDNADDLSWGIKEVLPKGVQGSVIITSQDNQARTLVDGGCEAVCVDTMEPLEASTLLLRHLELDYAAASDDVKRDCDRVSEQLGHLALALDLAGAYIQEQSTGPTRALQQYLQRFVYHKESLLKNEDFCGLRPSEKTVWTVWDMTLNRIDALEKRENPENPNPDLPARLLLAFLARFRGAVIQDEVFRLASAAVLETCDALYDGAVEPPSWLSNAFAVTVGTKEWDDYCYEKTRNRLVRFSLLKRTGGEWPGVSMHGLVQWQATKKEAEQSWEKWHLITVLAACAQLSKETARPHFRRELVTQLPSMEKKYLNDLGIEDKNKGFAWYTISALYFYDGRIKEAEKLIEQMLETSSRVLGKEHPDTLTSIANLASTYRNQGRWKEAEELEVQVMETRKRALSKEHPDTLTSMANLASTYSNQGRWKEAEELEVQVMETRKRVLGKEHPDTLTSMGNLALTFWYQGRWKEAEELEVQVMETRKRVLGKEHPSTLTSMANLAFTLKSQSRDEEALFLLETCFQLREQILGEQHPSTKSALAALEKWQAEKRLVSL